MAASKLCYLLVAHLLLAGACLARTAYARKTQVTGTGVSAPGGDDDSAVAHAGDTWAVIVSSSRYWLNYRHASNALGVYQAVRRLGLPDSRILLMLADQPACSPRNLLPGQVFLEAGAAERGGGAAPGGRHEEAPGNLLAADAEVDYRGREASVDSVLRVLTGRHAPGTPLSKQLRSGPNSSVLVYLTGHGGDEFLKFHDQEELLAIDIASALAQMHAAGRYRQLLLVADTCQASTLLSRVTAPNVLGIASSKLGQSSYAHYLDSTIGQHVVDQFSFHLHQFLATRVPPHPALANHSGTSSSSRHGEAVAAGATAVPSMQQLLDFLRTRRMSSDVQLHADLFPRRLSDVPVTEFFGMSTAAPDAPRMHGAQLAGGVGDTSREATRALLHAARQQAVAGGAQYLQPVRLAFQPGLHERPLFDVLVAAGRSRPGDGQYACHLAKAAAVLGAWAAAVAVAHWLLRSA